MAFPSVASVTITQVGTASTTHNIAMPATVAASDLLLCLISVNSIPTITTPAGWTAVGTVTGTSWGKTAVYAIAAVGDEDGTTVDFVTSTSQEAVAHVFRITAASWFGTVATGVAMATGVTGASSAPDPPELTPPWGSRETLWIALCHEDVLDEITGYPSSYTANQNHTSSGGAASAQIASCARTLLVASENPGLFSGGASFSWLATTVAVRPEGTTYLSSLVTSESRNFDRLIFDKDVFATDQGGVGGGGGGGSGGRGGGGGSGGNGGSNGGGGGGGGGNGGGPPLRTRGIIGQRRKGRPGLVNL